MKEFSKYVGLDVHKETGFVKTIQARSSRDRTRYYPIPPPPANSTSPVI